MTKGAKRGIGEPAHSHSKSKANQGTQPSQMDTLRWFFGCGHSAIHFPLSFPTPHTSSNLQLLKCTTFSHVVFPPCPTALLHPAFGSYKSCYVFPGLCPETGSAWLWGKQAGVIYHSNSENRGLNEW